MPDNRYDSSTRPDGNSNDQPTRVLTGTQQSNGQLQGSQQSTAPDLTVTVKQSKPEQEVRKEQTAGQGIGF